MKILQIGKYFPPYRGGMETVLENLVEGLLDSNVTVRTIVSGVDTVDRISTIKGPENGREGHLARLSCAGQLNSQPLNTTLISHLRQDIELFQPDLVHLHIPNPLAVLAWSLLAGWYGSRMPVLAVWHHADITRQRMGARLVRPFIKRTLRQSAGICVSTEMLAQNSVCLNGFSEKTEVIPFGISAEPWINIEPQRNGSFLFVGRLVPYKGLDILLDAMEKAPGTKLDVVGQGPMQPMLDARINQGSLAGRIKIHGICNPEQLVQLMSRARALVLPSLDQSETFGLVQLEAMASGVPVIASNLPSGVSEVGVDGETCLLVPPGDADALSAAMTKILKEDNLAQRLGSASRARFQDNFTREIMVRRVVSWYHRLLESQPPKGNL